MLKESWFGAISTAGTNYSSHLALPLTIPFQPLLLSTHPPCFIYVLPIAHYDSSTPSSAPPHRVLFIPDAFHPSPGHYITPNHPKRFPTAHLRSPPSLPFPTALLPSPSPYTPLHRPITLPTALYPSPSPYTPPYCPITFPTALYPSLSPYTPTYRPITLSVAL